MSPSLTELRRAIEALPPGAGVSLSREYLLEVLPSGPTDPGPTAELAIGDIAATFDRSLSTVRAWLEEGRFPGAYKLRGRSWRIPRDALEAFRDAQGNGAPAQLAPAPRRVLKRGESLGDWRKETPSAKAAKPAA